MGQTLTKQLSRWTGSSHPVQEPGLLDLPALWLESFFSQAIPQHDIHTLFSCSKETAGMVIQHNISKSSFIFSKKQIRSVSGVVQPDDIALAAMRAWQLKMGVCLTTTACSDNPTPIVQQHVQHSQHIQSLLQHTLASPICKEGDNGLFPQSHLSGRCEEASPDDVSFLVLNGLGQQPTHMTLTDLCNLEIKEDHNARCVDSHDQSDDPVQLFIQEAAQRLRVATHDVEGCSLAGIVQHLGDDQDYDVSVIITRLGVNLPPAVSAKVTHLELSKAEFSSTDFDSLHVRDMQRLKSATIQCRFTQHMLCPGDMSMRPRWRTYLRDDVVVSQKMFAFREAEDCVTVHVSGDDDYVEMLRALQVHTVY